MTEERIIAYLLEELPEAERERFEDECLTAEEWPEEISLAEESLIDGYLRGELTPIQRANFEQNYLTTTARAEKLVNAKALLRHADQRQKQNTRAAEITWGQRWDAFRGGWRLALAAAAFALVVLSAGLWWRRSAPEPPETYYALTLQLSKTTRDPGSQGNKEINRTPYPLGKDKLYVTLMLPPDIAPATTYRVEMLRSDTSETIKFDSLTGGGGLVILTIPATQISRGQYLLKLYARDANGKEMPLPGGYYFDVG